MDFSKLLQEFVKIDSIEKFLLFIILFKLDLSKLLHVFLLLLIDTWICQIFYMDLLKLLRGFVRVVLCNSHPLPDTTTLKFDQDIKVC